MNIRPFLILILGLLSCQLGNAQSADDIISKYINFTGGAEAWKNVKTIISSGEYNYGGMPFPFTTYSKAPDRYKLIVPFNGKFYAQAFNGSKGWKLDAFKNETKPTWLTGKEAKALANEADVELENAFINYSAKGHQASTIASDTVNGATCYVIKLIRKGGEVERYYFKQQTYELLMKLAQAKNAELGGAPLRIYYSDYRITGGIKIPFKTVCESEGQTILTITTTESTINKAIDDKEFQP